jgi:hypothetical protein
VGAIRTQVEIKRNYKRNETKQKESKASDLSFAYAFDSKGLEEVELK